MRKQYLSAPLPFQGQKRMFAKEYINVLQQFPDGTTFVDLFGGSGLLSHIAKCQKPHSRDKGTCAVLRPQIPTRLRLYRLYHAVLVDYVLYEVRHRVFGSGEGNTI